MLLQQKAKQDAGQLATAGQRYCVGIVGAGHVGCYLGAHLCQDHALDIKFFGREIMALELAAHGLSATSFDHQSYFVQPVAFYSSLHSLIECDVVLLTVKATALIPMLAQLNRFLRPDVPVVALQNGIGIGEMLSQDLPNPVLRALVPFNIVKPKAGQFYRAGAGSMVWQQNNFAAVNYIISVCNRLQLRSRVQQDITAAEYGRLLFDLNNALNAISRLPLRQQLLERNYRLLLAAAMQEWLAVCAARGVKPLAFTCLPNRLLPYILHLPTVLFQYLPAAILPADGQVRSAMWHDLQAGRRTEIMFLNGAVARMAQQHHLRAPVNSLLTECIKRAESGDTAYPAVAELLQAAKLS